jgi:hypothetical protein
MGNIQRSKAERDCVGNAKLRSVPSYIGRCLDWILILGMLVACSQKDMLQRFASPTEQAIAQKYIDELRSLDFGDIEKAIDPTIAEEVAGGTLAKMAALIPNGTPTSVQLVGANRFSSESAGTTLNLTYEYQFGTQYLLMNVATKTKNGVLTIVGFRVLPESASLEAQNKFNLSGRSVLQYGVLGAAIMMAIFTLVALAVCIRTKMKRRKWLWILFILFGFGKLSVNWATGQWGVMVLAAQLFSASGTAAYFGPWIVSVSLPVGAVLFLMNRRRLEVTPAMDGGALTPIGNAKIGGGV